MYNLSMENLVIVGGGPAAYTAAIYAARANLNPLVLEGYAPGGLLMQTEEVENFPGFPTGILGPDLMQLFRTQAENAGARLLQLEAETISLSTNAPFELHKLSTLEGDIETKALVLATGSQPLKLGVTGEDKFNGKGVSYCATCDGAFFKDKEIYVVGGGDSGAEEALYLANLSPHVTLLHRRNELRASKVLQDRLASHPNISVVKPWTVEEIRGEEKLQSLTLKNTHSGERRIVDADGLFVAIGHKPLSHLFSDLLPLDANGYVKTANRSSLTVLPGVFACGDLIDPVYRQAITAAGSGCVASIDAEKWLSENS